MNIILPGIQTLMLSLVDVLLDAPEQVGFCKFFRMLASQSIPSWNQIIAWLREVETLRKAAA